MNEVSISHSVAWSLIPWLVNGTITTADRERLERHLGACEECHAQFLLEGRIRDTMQVEVELDDDSDAALARLFERIDADCATSEKPVTQPHAVAPAPRWNRWLAAAVIVQAISLGTLGAMHLKSTGGASPSTSAEYRTLSRPAAITQTAVIRFVPAPDMSIATMHSVLAEVDVRIVESSPHSAIFGLALVPTAASEDTEQRISKAVRTLSRRSDVLFAEPILSPAQSTDD